MSKLTDEDLALELNNVYRGALYAPPQTAQRFHQTGLLEPSLAVVRRARELLALQPDHADELADVRADITRTSLVLAALAASVPVAWPPGYSDESERQQAHLLALLYRERELMAAAKAGG
jgi:hypothetical protein